MTYAHYRRLVNGSTPLSVTNQMAFKAVYHVIEKLHVRGSFRDPLFATPRYVQAANTDIFLEAWEQHVAD